MCGIAGFYGFQDEKLIKQMSKCIEHRGPDGEGFYINNEISMLSRRLAIIDRAGGDQPIYNEDKTIVVVYNGEIYNYKELRKTLEAAGHTFSTKTDTEVIVHGYEEWGENCFNKFNGMFGIALYDEKQRKLILTRDHFGIKPLYYSRISNPVNKKRDSSPDSKRDQNDEIILFSSEIKPLLQSGLIKPEVNERILYRYLKFRIHEDGRETFFQNIERLLPGEMLIINAEGIQTKKFSTLETELEEIINQNNKLPLNDTEIKKFRQLLLDSVRRRLISEVPVGTALSGGLDSSTIVAIVNRLLQKQSEEASSVGTKQKTFSAIFPGEINDEEKYIDTLLANYKKIQSHKVYPKPEDFFADLSDFIKTQEEPTISSGPYAQYQVMKEAKDHVTVLLDGQGADEMMAGYLPYYFIYLRQLWKEKKYSRLSKELQSSLDVIYKFSLLVLKQKLGLQQKLNISSMLDENFSSTHENEKFEVITDNLKKRLFDDIFKNSLPALLRYEDRNTMRFSLEGRVPFLDFRLLKYLFTLSNEAIINNGWNKYILRKSFDHIVPDAITWRRSKIGFTTPEHEWFLKMKKEIYEIFLSESFSTRPYFNQKKVLESFRDFISGRNDDTLLFWRILNVELWLREFIDEREKSQDTSYKIQVAKFGEANKGKKIEIDVQNKIYKRIPIRTERFEKGDDYAIKIASILNDKLKKINNLKSKISHLSIENKWYVVVSEKVVAISQGRSFFIWDINPGWWANTLSKFVTRTPAGIGLGSPWTMQIAINEIGLPRILFATAASVITKPFGLKGVFYKVAGGEINAIDGPTEYSVYPSNVSAKLAPKDPQKAAEKIREKIQNILSSRRSEATERSQDFSPAVRNDDISDTFGGVVIIDANDIGRNVLGNATDKKNSFFEQVMRDNPMGQGSEMTPIVIVM